MLAGLGLLLAALPALAVQLSGNLVNSPTLNTSNLPIDAYVDLDFGSAVAPFRADGSFSFGEVKPGQHVVRPMVRGYAMTDLMVTVPTDDAAPHVQLFIAGKQALPVSTASLEFPLLVGATYAQSFYTEANAMNILQMLKSPMVLMMLASGVMAFVFPKLTASMDDPELAAEMAAQRKRMTAASQMDWTGALASRLAGEQSPSNAPAPGTASLSAASADATGTSSPGPAAARAPARGGASGAKRGGKRR
ncbi:hypothetical protein CcaverHIS002_0303240 [Cutaneotrichosporon cavernicola]|uniref:ER membrane protein complex subunit 7 beta-sandwich domain-containing protein n=1 Tax=Cutaneotrichosporon cavernicola TaxID=279322 RepID=A0AA48I5X7_9TREE|nr:uncharacterized protein CcaverHIS019_0303240 [Cutaneotrichosporon cavernicola]BEI82456.1 hypothetical protein CcaverHIS002_0303240 [Cutaneotrichosporon cavernicola]BEI90254.1 hypothetical protein CcaverHIS019_0303240 [Cutaneotrichosporon cavernicola]BEI98031.1 hypothetical protein CcaverHIS631_0303300 [Cutaneotrichosporon cavernicola]BEJ05808.1 hypothetical protein CcaverHIS641_0303300 [Cutaneotrichosporon cavernicola]